MKRKMELILKILRYSEENATGGMPLGLPSFSDYSREEVNYHTGLCHEAGYLHTVENIIVGKPKSYEILGLTWEGHEILLRTND